MSCPSSCAPGKAEKAALADAKRRIQARKGEDAGPEGPVAVDPGRSVTRRGGRREWFRVARRQLEEQRERERRPIPRDRDERLFEAVRRLEENHQVELTTNEAYELWRRTSRDTLGRALRGHSTPYTPPQIPDGKISTSDPDSRVMRTQGTPPQQAYNAQTTVNDRQVILAAEITVDARTSGIWSRCSTRPCANYAASESKSSRR